jgi:hypothetical protein
MSHARLAPSQRYRWAACPASIRACAAYPSDGPSSPAAIDGTHSHTLLEACLKQSPPADPHKFIGLTLTDHEGTFGVDKDRADRVKVAVDYINSRLDESPPKRVISEKKVNPVALLRRSDMFGTVDVQLIDNDVLEVIDYKDGMNEVSADGNEQLEQYAVSIISEYVERGDIFPFKYVRLTIIQPKLALVGKNPVSSAQHEVNSFLMRVLQALSAQAEATGDPNAPFVPGEKQCKYCPHNANCEAAFNHRMAASGIKFEAVKLPAAAADEPVGEQMSDERLREIIEAAPLLRQMIENAESEALRRIQSGHPVAGIKVVRGRGMRKWAKEPGEVEKQLKQMHMPKGTIWKTVLITPTQAEKATWTNRAGDEKQLSERQLKVLETNLITKTEGDLIVVPEADGRAAVSFGNIEQTFKPVQPTPEAAEQLPDWLKS